MTVELNGLWKDTHYGLLVQLHGASVNVVRLPQHPLNEVPPNSMPTVKAVVRVITGDERMMETYL